MIEVKDLTMYYGHTLAVDKASFEVGEGAILALLGPNGAGKTTIMNILTTQIAPTSGTVTVNGYDVNKKPVQVRERIGYLPETVPLYMDMEVAEYLRFVASGRRLNADKAKERMDWVVEACGLKRMFRKQILELSKGYRQRVGLAQALIHDPEILVLDEPTSGLDPLQIIGIRDLIKELSSLKTIIVSTHILQEISAVSDRVVIINEGQIIFNGTIPDLEGAASDSRSYIVALQGDPGRMESLFQNVAGVINIERMDPWEVEGCYNFKIQFEKEKDLWPDLASIIRDENWLVKFFSEHTPSLEDAFISLTRSARKSIW